MSRRDIEPNRRRRVVLAAGGTAGHVYPALALAQAFETAADPFSVSFIGARDGLEARLVPPTGYPFAVVRAAPLLGVPLLGKLEAVRSLCAGIREARHLLARSGTKLVLGLGGYASAGTLLGAWSLGLRTAIHEANVVPGFTNKFLGRVVDRVYLGFQAAAKAFPRSRTIVTGNPVRPEIARITAPQTPPAFQDRPWRILVTGGSLGSQFFNERAPVLIQCISSRGRMVEVLHQTGQYDEEPVRRAYAAARVTATVAPYLTDMGQAYGWADFVLACAGANTLAEMAATGVPALLVPLSAAAQDHQTPNAIAFAEAGGGWWVSERDWRADALAARIAGLLSDGAAWLDASRRARRLARPDAARRLVADCETMIRAS
jgi:UDP-N-acetylglucosamine--N-acetylmuramyl-(pentapeptide) pyrophosphoryl-undecaprenol N-acetylglucosamine transferase